VYAEGSKLIGPSGGSVGWYLRQIAELSAQVEPERITRVAEVLREGRERKATFYVFGNGGSASSASHLACDLGKGAASEVHGGMRIHSLVENAAVVTAWANDHDFNVVFSEQLKLLLDAGDMVIAISASGNSPNVVQAAEVAREMGATVIGLSGFDGGRLAELAHHSIVVPSHDYGVVETIHLALVHALAYAIREADRQG
jgi:D-sedoheptulose 7-phosphate isomerase